MECDVLGLEVYVYEPYRCVCLRGLTIATLSSKFYGDVHDYLIAKLHHAQNAAARLVTKAKLRTKITPVLQSRHWLPITECIHFKVQLLTYKAVHGSSISTGAGN